MFKPLGKIFLIVVTVWGITFFMVMKEYKKNKLLLGGYENALKQFEKSTRMLKNLTYLNGMY